MVIMAGMAALMFWYFGLFARVGDEYLTKKDAMDGIARTPSDSFLLQYDPQVFLYPGIALIAIGVVSLVHFKKMAQKAKLAAEQ